MRKHALFKPVEDQFLQWKQAYRTTQCIVPARHLIYRQDEPLQEAYTLFEGWVMLFKSLEDGKRQVLRIALPGDFLGYQAGQELNAGHCALALTQCILCAFPKASVDEMVVKHPELTRRLIQMHMQTMAQCQERLASLGQKNAKARVATFLLDLLYRLRERSDAEGNRMAFHMTQEEVADAVGITPVHVSRVMRQLRDMGAVEFLSRSEVILDESELAAAASLNAPSTSLR